MEKTTLLLGHRGVRHEAGIPENSPAAFDWALEQGCDGFEFDVRCSVDGVALLRHDSRFRQQAIARTLARDLDELPRLDDILRHYANRAFLDIELKVGKLEEIVLSALNRRPPQRGYVVSSFLPEVLLDVRALSASAVLGYICDNQRKLSKWRELPCAFVIPHQRLVTRALIDEVHASGKQLLVWTVNRRSQMVKFTEWGVDGVISDKPGLLAGALGKPTDKACGGLTIPG